MRRPLVLANWKMNLSLAQSRGLAREIVRGFDLRGVDLGVCPSDPHLIAVGEILDASPVGLLPQDLVAEIPGAFTGGVAAE